MKHLLDLGLRFASFLYLVFQFLVVGAALLPAVLFVKLFWSSGSPFLLAFAFGVCAWLWRAISGGGTTSFAVFARLRMGSETNLCIR